MPIPAAILGAGVSGISNIASNLIGNSGSKRSQTRANNQNIAFWNMQNKYNHPVEQMARLKQAGLNPNLVYGGSPAQSAGNAEKIAPSKASEFKFDNPLNHMSSFQDFKIKNVQTDNLQAQNDVLTQDAILKGQQSVKTAAEGLSANAKAQVDQRLINTSVEAQKELLRQTQARTIGYQIDNLVSSRTAAAKVKEAYYKLTLLGKQITGQQKLNELRQLEKELKAEGLENANPIMRWLFRQTEGNNSWFPIGTDDYNEK